MTCAWYRIYRSFLMPSFLQATHLEVKSIQWFLFKLCLNTLYAVICRRISVRIYAELRSSNRHTISERWIYFISSVKACVIRRGRVRLANDNQASTLPGQQSFKRWAIFSVKVDVLVEVFILGICAIMA